MPRVVADPLNNPWVILALMFLVLGPLALPLLWRSTRFSRSAKIALTVTVSIVTALVVVALYLVIKSCVEQLRAIFEAIDPREM